MEFLLTYSWAIAIMTGVLAVLFYLGVFDYRLISPTGCELQGGFSCNAFKITSDGTLNLDLVQTTGHTLYISQVACTAATTQTYTTVNSRIYNGDKLRVNVTCYKADGTVPVADDLYTGTLYFRYVDEDTNINRSMIGKLSARVEQ